jgi:dTDP-4-amino-4,6-dideoxygalactose transaminase
VAEGVYKVTVFFERRLAEYTGAKYAVAVDNCSNAIFLTLMYQNVAGRIISIPERTYQSVPCEIIHAGARVEFWPVKGKSIKGAYQLGNTKTYDSALRFTHNMYIPNAFMCLSFTGPHKHLKLGKGGAILTDSARAYEWFKRSRFSGRRECSYHEDDIDMLGWNFYMMPDIAARGALLMDQFYDMDGCPIANEDIEISYPNLRRFKVYET